jgi:hypothetical protein
VEASVDEFEFEDLEPKKKPAPAPAMAPPITITIGAPQPALGLGSLGELAECEDEYTDDPDDYSKPNPMRALKAMFGKG